MKIALAQICSTDDVQHNIRVSEQVAKRAAAANAEIVFFPECADIVFSPDYDVKRERKELKDTARYVGEMKRIAKETGLWLHFGCHLPSTEDKEKWFNSALTIDPSGTIVHRYDKIHPCEVHLGDEMDVSESESVTNGLSNQPGLQPFEIKSRSTGETWKMGVMICYDVRYPQLAAMLRARGAEVIIQPTAWFPATRAHWEPLVTARAIENQVYFVAAGQVGSHNDSRQSFGMSFAVDPWGEQTLKLPDLSDVEKKNGRATEATSDSTDVERLPEELGGLQGACIGYATLDRQKVLKLRKQVPVCEFSRPDVYGELGEK